MKLYNLDKLRIGTRGSALAIAQTNIVIEKLELAFPSIKDIIEIKKINVSGDAFNKHPLRNHGGKGLFTKEIDQAVIDGDVDLAVHSLKDMDSCLSKGLTIVAVTEREDAREFFVSKEIKNLYQLKVNSIVGTSSLRRKAQLLNIRPDLKFTNLRGNVLKRLEKFNSGEFDATILAYAGLKRLSIVTDGFLLDLDSMLPCLGQGIIGIVTSERNEKIIDIISQINHSETFNQMISERSLLGALKATCNTPISGIAKIIGDKILLRSEVYSYDGKEIFDTEIEGKINESKMIGLEAGKILKKKIPNKILESW